MPDTPGSFELIKALMGINVKDFTSLQQFLLHFNFEY